MRYIPNTIARASKKTRFVSRGIPGGGGGNPLFVLPLGFGCGGLVLASIIIA